MDQKILVLLYIMRILLVIPFGYGIYVAIFRILEHLGHKYDKKEKSKCLFWIIFFSLHIRRTCAVCLMIAIATTYSIPTHSFGSESRVNPQGKSFFDLIDPFDVSWISEGLSAFNENSSIEDVVKFAAKVKVEIERFTGEHHSVKGLFKNCRKEMKKNGIKVGKHYFDGIENMIRQAEKDLIMGKKGFIPKRKPPLDGEYLILPVGQCIGCVEVFCGVLICVLPIPFSGAVGGTVIADGCSRILTSIMDEGRIR